MANSIMTQELAETIAATVKQNIPIVSRVNNDLDKLLVPGAGDIVSVLRPGYGEVSEGASFRNQATGEVEGLDINVDKIPVKIGIVKMGARFDIIEKSLKLNTFETQVAEPYSANLGSKINAKVFKAVLGAAHSSLVGQLSFNDLGDAVSYVQNSRVGNEISGMLAPLAASGIIGTGANKFANDRIGERLYKGEIGEFAGAEFFSSPDAGALKLGNTAAQAWAFTATAAQINDQDETVTLSGFSFGGDTLAVIPAGTPFIIGSGNAGTPGSISSGVNVSDVFGNDTGVMRTFVAMADTPITGGTAVIPIAQVFLAGGAGAVPNTYYDGEGTAIPSGAVVCPLFAGTSYYTGAVFASNSVAFAARTPQPLGGNADSVSTELDGEVGVRVSTIPGFTDGVDRWRMDVMCGVAPLYGNGAVALYVQRL